MSNIRTATVDSGITASLQSLYTLLNGVSAIAGRTRHYDDAIIENTGSVPLYFAVVDDLTQVPTNADRKSLAAGQVKSFEELDILLIYIATSDIGGTNALEFEGKPVYRP